MHRRTFLGAALGVMAAALAAGREVAGPLSPTTDQSTGPTDEDVNHPRPFDTGVLFGYHGPTWDRFRIDPPTHAYYDDALAAWRPWYGPVPDGCMVPGGMRGALFVRNSDGLWDRWRGPGHLPGTRLDALRRHHAEQEDIV